jgi:hypothetical protein
MLVTQVWRPRDVAAFSNQVGSPDDSENCSTLVESCLVQAVDGLRERGVIAVAAGADRRLAGGLGQPFAVAAEHVQQSASTSFAPRKADLTNLPRHESPRKNCAPVLAAGPARRHTSL